MYVSLFSEMTQKARKDTGSLVQCLHLSQGASEVQRREGTHPTCWGMRGLGPRHPAFLFMVLPTSDKASFLWAWLTLLFVPRNDMQWSKFKFHCSLLVSRKEMDFCILTLTSYNLAITTCQFQEFFCSFFQIFYIDDHGICKHSFITSFPICTPLVSSCCLRAYVRTSGVMLRRAVKGDVLAFYLILLGKLWVSYQ